MKSGLRRHDREIHRKQEEVASCIYCGKTLSRKEVLQSHEEMCYEEMVRKKRTMIRSWIVNIVKKKFI